ncbi:MAG: metal ABC transporter permease, partial [Planctomycetia bacterium]
ERFGGVPEDASLGVVFTTLFAIGVLLMTQGAANVDLDPGCVLYGLIEFVPLDTVSVFGFDVPRAMGTLSAALLLTTVALVLFWKEFKLASFDPALATAMGFSAVGIHYLLVALVSVVTVASFEAVGSILVVAMLIVPAATAQLLCDRLSTMLTAAAVVGVLSALLGYAGGVWLNTSVAGMMAAAAGLQFTAAVFLAPRHGLVSRYVRNRLLALRIAGEDLLARLYRSEEQAARGETPAVGDPRTGAAGLLRLFVVPNLRRQGLVDSTPAGGVGLTDRGRRSAESLVRSHRLWEAYLAENIDLPADHLHDPAERVEHFIGPGLQEALREDLGGRRLDPHGRPIPDSTPRSDR